MTSNRGANKQGRPQMFGKKKDTSVLEVSAVFYLKLSNDSNSYPDARIESITSPKRFVLSFETA